MPLVINHHCTTDAGDRVHVAEASTLGLEPGDWPATLLAAPGFGNGLPLVRSTPHYRDGDLCMVDYKQAAGDLTLRVFND